MPPPVEATKPAAPPRAEVRVPRVGRPRSTAPAAPAIPARKPLEQIRLEMETDAELNRTAGPPLPSGPLLDEREKQRCASLMEFRGRLPAPPRAPAGAPRQPRTEVEVLEEMFDRVVAEIDERKRFLEEMSGRGRDKEFRAMMQGEIADRVRELDRLDRLIKTAV